MGEHSAAQMDLLLDSNAFTQFAVLLLVVSCARPLVCSVATLMLTRRGDGRHRERILKILCDDRLVVGLVALFARRSGSPRRNKGEKGQRSAHSPFFQERR